ncbi:MAG: glycoside hydrolase 43 family protein [Prevotellaceae bacterium]|nr:glycoside hydrolase 43 family protein [Prevotellaceae bacterium]
MFIKRMACMAFAAFALGVTNVNAVNLFELEECEESGFCNPVIWADVPDPDVIRVEEDFYMVSTTMHLMPGCPVMRSRDLVNWETIGYVFDKLEDTPRYDMEGGTVYGKGQWATSIRYRNGRFYVLFSPNDEPYKSYIYTTENPAGKWTLLCRTNHFHDSSLFFDDDGRVFVFSGSGNISLTELKPDLTGVLSGGIDKVVIHPDSSETGLHEGSRVIKHNGMYYVFIISWPAGKPRRQLCYRADHIEGPYEKCVVLESQFGGFPYVGQGCLVDDSDGNWWGMIFQDRGGVGCVLTLNPCTWTDGWPMLGDSDGKVPLNVAKNFVRLRMQQSVLPMSLKMARCRCFGNGIIIRYPKDGRSLSIRASCG